MMYNRYERIFVLCPTTLTGGPEALHQLAQLTNEAGIETRLGYYGTGSIVRGANGRLILKPDLQNPCVAGYAKYNPLIGVGDYPLDDRTLVVLPEVIAWHAERVKPADVAVWWLSVDNAFHRTSPLRREAERRSFFADRSIHHLCQTNYAAGLLRREGVERIYDLVDYTDDAFTLRPPLGPNSGAALAYNPKKGVALAEAFFAENPGFEPRRIEEMTKAQIVEVFRQTRTYVEFGHNPGKDRMPREAACAGCIIVARKLGGTAHFGDVPLSNKFKFSEEDVGSGRLTALLREIDRDPQPFWEEQAYYRRYLYSERALMKLQVERLFGRA